MDNDQIPGNGVVFPGGHLAQRAPEMEHFDSSAGPVRLQRDALSLLAVINGCTLTGMRTSAIPQK